mmetsp:Transcript_14562/g.21940  ORF Transcript_14562/g.21940 Transcript_14562/m.21940 type:complete len:263 (-) Transcript_14562:91-879(-)|eukprot:scaffold10871_cov131-Skeletonema_dohrnii-CCMP3373.AAC.3
MIASHPITHRWCSLLVAIATMISFTLAEDSSSLVGNSNDQPYPKRPSSIIRIDLDDFLSINSTISSSADTITTEDEDEDTVVEKLHAPKKNPAVKSMPEMRFTLWSELSSHEKDVATRLLGYDENTWDNPMTNPIEMFSYTGLSIRMKSGLSALQISQPEWDCHVNHYYGYKWDELVEVGVHVHLAMLGWTKESWEYGNVTAPDVEVMTWDELSERQKVIANELCYFRETWDELPLSTWLAAWRKVNGRRSPRTSSSLKAVK